MVKALARTRPAAAAVRHTFPAVIMGRRESERATLAGLLLAIDADPGGAADVLGRLSPAMFTDTICAEIMHAVQAAVQSERPGIASVAACIRRNAHAAGTDYSEATSAVAELLEMFVGPDPLVAAGLAAEEVAEVYRRRSALDAMDDARRALIQCTSGDDLAEIVERLEALRDVGNQAATAAGLVDVLDAWAKHEAEPVVRTMFGPIDDRFGGGLPVGITGIAARPSHGKSALAMQLTLGSLLADPTATAVWFRGEMTNPQLASRMAAVWSAMRGEPLPAITARDARRRTKAARQVAVDLAETISNRLTVVDPPLLPATLERELVRRKPTLAVVDYLQRCEAPGLADRRAEIEYVTRLLSRLATANNVAVIVVSSIAKGTQVGSGIGSLGKESNVLDYDAHAFLTLWGDDERKSDDPREIQMRIEKSRDGGEGSVTLQFSGSSQFFTVDPKDEPPAFDEFSRFAPEVVL
jgi:replicative DNA helicase